MWAASAIWGSLMATGCAAAEPSSYPTELTSRVSDIFPSTKALDTSVLSVKIEVYNPGSSAIGVREIRYVLDTGDLAGTIKGVVDAGATLAADQQAELGFDIDVPLPAAAERLRALATQEMVSARLEGEVRFEDGSLTSFHRETALAMPTPPDFVVFDAQAARYAQEGVDVTFLLRLINENTFPVSIREVDYVVVVGGRELRAAQAGVGSRLVAGSAEEFEVRVQLDSSSLDGVPEMLASGEINYRVVGQVTTRELSVPFDHEGQIGLERTEP